MTAKDAEPRQADEPTLTMPIPANNGVEVVVSGSLLVIRKPNFQQDAMVAVLTHDQAADVVKSLVAAHNLRADLAATPNQSDEQVARHIVGEYWDRAESDDDEWLISRIAAALAQKERSSPECEWKCDPNPDCEVWETTCGEAFQFETDGPTENKFRFCCYCGGVLVARIATALGGRK
jgi:hypothetical protein